MHSLKIFHDVYYADLNSVYWGDPGILFKMHEVHS